LAPAE